MEPVRGMQRCHRLTDWLTDWLLLLLQIIRSVGHQNKLLHLNWTHFFECKQQIACSLAAWLTIMDICLQKMGHFKVWHCDVGRWPPRRLLEEDDDEDEDGQEWTKISWETYWPWWIDIHIVEWMIKEWLDGHQMIEWMKEWRFIFLFD